MPRHEALAAGIASMVPNGNTAVHRIVDPAHRNEVWVAVAAWVVSPPSSRPSLMEIAKDLNEQYGLSLTDVDIRTATTYISRPLAIQSLPESTFKALVKSEQEISLLMEKRKMFQHLSEKLMEAYLPGADMGPKDIAALQRAYTQLADSIESTQQALGISPVPVAKSESVSEVRRFDLKATLNRHGLDPQQAPADATVRGEVFDVEAKGDTKSA